MVRASTVQSDHLATDGLFQLATHHLACPMAVLSQHKAQSEQPTVLAAFNMCDDLAQGIAHSVHGSAAFDNWLPDSSDPECAPLEIEKEYLPDAARGGARFTFVSQVEPTSYLALSVCRLDPEPYSMRVLAAQEVRCWIEAHLRLLWQSRRDRGRADVMAQTLDLFDFGTFLLDPEGTIIFANDRASQLLDLGEGLRRAGQSVTATDFDNAVRLQSAIHHLSHHEQGTSCEVDSSLMLMHRTNARPLVAVLSRLAETEPGNGGAATVLYVLDPDIDTGPLAMALCRAYGLTATEAGLVIKLVGGLTIDAAARDMRIQTQTARAYLKQIFAKTDTHRQADLVRVILGGVIRIRASAALPPQMGVMILPA
ncbi:MAG: hypothetical protein J7493_10675 [Porphyrobacter sp.]|nr:hypothetical protein [Porphyrobacter sp.]